MSQIARGPVAVRPAGNLGSGVNTQTSAIEALGHRQVSFHLTATNATPLATVTLEISADGATYETATTAKHGIVMLGVATGIDLSSVSGIGAILYVVMNDARQIALPLGLLRLSITNTAASLTGFAVNAYGLSEVERLSTR